MPEPGIPESFKVLIRELQSLALDIKVLNNSQEVKIGESVEYSESAPLGVNIAGREDAPSEDVIDSDNGFSIFDDDEPQDIDLSSFKLEDTDDLQ